MATETSQLRTAVGSLSWYSRACRPDLAFGVNQLQAIQQRARVEDLVTAYRVARPSRLRMPWWSASTMLVMVPALTLEKMENQSVTDPRLEDCWHWHRRSLRRPEIRRFISYVGLAMWSNGSVDPPYRQKQWVYSWEARMQRISGRFSTWQRCTSQLWIMHRGDVADGLQKPEWPPIPSMCIRSFWQEVSHRLDESEARVVAWKGRVGWKPYLHWQASWRSQYYLLLDLYTHNGCWRFDQACEMQPIG